MSHTHLYRHFDAEGVLLYVGISLSAVQRLASHASASHWFDRIATVTIETYPTRDDALEAERNAIITELPLFNLDGVKRRAKPGKSNVGERDRPNPLRGRKGAADELLPLSKPEKLGLPFKRRVLGRRIVDGSFPPPTKINGRLYITRRALSEYKARLINGCP
jgi:hypothetical protein